MEGSKSILSPTTSFLLFDETLSSSDFDGEELIEHEYGDDDEYIQTLLDKEIANDGPQMQEFLHSSGIQRARSEGIHYILRVEKSRMILPLATACLSLAAKMEEIGGEIRFHAFCVGDFNFESNVIHKMELLVLNALGWKMRSYTPFVFIKFFTKKLCDKSLSQKEFSRTVDLIINAMTDTKIMCNRSYVIAAAATLAVLDEGLTKNALKLRIGGLASPQSFDIESIFSCYSLFREKEMERLKINRSTPVSSPVQFQPRWSISRISMTRLNF